MILATDLTGFPAKRFPNLVVALGVFDGMHRGHRVILKKVRAEAKKIGGKTAVLTFHEHPQNVLTPEKKTELLTSFWHKLSLLENEGVDLCISLRFSEAFSRLSPEEFVTRILLRKLKVKTVVLGHDSRFGYQREGDARLMAELARKFGFRLITVRALNVAGGTVSSTRIRKLIAEGNIPLAKRLLGRECSVVASVVKGRGRGRKLGFPTANLNPHSEVLPPDGVYVIRVRSVEFQLSGAGCGFKRFLVKKPDFSWPAIMNLGTSPTFQRSAKVRVPEAHILKFQGNLYGKTLEVDFLTRLRSEMKFPTPEALQAQIVQDIREAERFF